MRHKYNVLKNLLQWAQYSILLDWKIENSISNVQINMSYKGVQVSEEKDKDNRDGVFSRRRDSGMTKVLSRD